MRFIIVLCSILISINVSSQDNTLLQSGPMVGFSDYREVLIWVQTKESADVRISYWNTEEPRRTTSVVTTKKEDAFIAKLYPDSLTYGQKYSYELFINGAKVERPYDLSFQSLNYWQYRTDPPEIQFALGSCYYNNEPKDDRPGRPYGDQFGIFDQILAKQPDFMMWLGDNTYLRTPDLYSKRGLLHRYTRDRSNSELQALLGSVHNYAIWDDHDYGPNDSDQTYELKEETERIFNLFWGNPNTNLTGEGGITGRFHWGDIEFFLLDNRYHRDPNRLKSEDKVLLGNAQVEWLIKSLVSSRATFKFVCIGGQTVSSADVYENYATFSKERDYLLKRLDEEKIEGVIFLSGDRHHSEISRMDRQGAYPLHDFTCSPLTSGTHKYRDEGNKYAIAGLTYNEKNFGFIEVVGPRKKRSLVYTLYDNLGNQIYQYNLAASDLTYPD